MGSKGNVLQGRGAVVECAVLSKKTDGNPSCRPFFNSVAGTAGPAGAPRITVASNRQDAAGSEDTAEQVKRR
jgi:hypothetical protein